MIASIPTTLKIAVAQLNCVLGDFAHNAKLIKHAAELAHAGGADILITPELSLCGYPPEDLLLREDFYRSGERELLALAAALPAIPVLVGHPELSEKGCFNAASLLEKGLVRATYRKVHLPNYAVFDEERYFDAGDRACVVDIRGVRIGINICADIWNDVPVDMAYYAGAEVLFVLNASPYHMNKQAERFDVLRRRIAHAPMAALYCNMVGGQDELVFDGASFALNADGKLAYQSAPFIERLDFVSYTSGAGFHDAPMLAERSLEANVYDALKMGVRDYLGKNGFPGALIGLSGGVDSALTLCVAVDALGAEKVHAVMMPSPYTAQMSLDDSRALIQALGVRYHEMPIEPAMRVFDTMLAPFFEGRGMDTTEENLQARIRGTSLMALSNKLGSIVLTTGNKSEMAVGYATLYGDMAGGFAVIKDIFKTLVYRLCTYRNGLSAVIPSNILTRAPSAELRHNQTDQDSLPPYDILDAIIEAYMERNLSAREIVAEGYAQSDVRRVVGMIKRNEYKRRQAPIGIRVSQRGFGKDWRYPITNCYQDEW